jgi:integrase
VPKIRLTKSLIDNLVPGRKDAVYWDEALAGFGLKVTPKGRKVFIVMYRTRDPAARLRKYTIGPYGPTTLASARVVAQKVLAARAEGRDPAAERREARRRAVLESVEAVSEDFLIRHLASKRSSSEMRRVIEREIVGVWRGRSIHDIGKRDVIALLDAIVDRGSPGTANRAYSVLRSMMNWCVNRSILDRSPCDGLPDPAPERARDRVLGDRELSAVISAARKIGFPYGYIIEMLSLTAQRRSEVSGMVWTEVDLETGIWTIPSFRSKNNKPHLVHLASAAVDLLRRVPRVEPMIFSNFGSKPFQNWSEMKRTLDNSSGVSGWVLHDLRRTVVSGMARLGIAPHVADRILNHQSGTISGVAAVYQRHEFLQERRAALEMWAAHVSSLIREPAL